MLHSDVKLGGGIGKCAFRSATEVVKCSSTAALVQMSSKVHAAGHSLIRSRVRFAVGLRIGVHELVCAYPDATPSLLAVGEGVW